MILPRTEAIPCPESSLGQGTSVLLAQEQVESDQLRVELPPHISASRLVALGGGPGKGHPCHAPPRAHQTRHGGTQGNGLPRWIEDFFGTTGQLDFDEDPGRRRLR